ncbi:MAG: bifunctional precorrin-2 dehydrogenase/sirohydrochlorin ferrochelatase [Deltaproteobacteria bacterium]|jgi:precorrin-2 dehydrogenase/sirohydrochlorin ferrochelatase|nr:bifunctional precorrin-2 dehydrogenase/sirohydrochlorin ferrochelatase [Deltaproteobacteria bacterium]
MSYYPLFFELGALRVLLAGAGEVGRRKAADLLAASPQSLLWLDPLVEERALPENLRGHPALRYVQREAVPEDALGCGLVFAAADSRAVNENLALFCRGRGIPCNVADNPREGNFIVPARFFSGDFALALSTGGQSPALAGLMCRELEKWYKEKYEALLKLLGRLRPLVLAGGGDPARHAELFRAVAQSELGDALNRRDGRRAGRILRRLLPESLHQRIEDLLHDLY